MRIAIAEENAPFEKGSVAASPWITATLAAAALGRKRVVVLEASHACRPRPQLLRRRTQPRTQLQHVLAKLRAFENPRQKLPPRYIPPERRSANPCFESIHR